MNPMSVSKRAEAPERRRIRRLRKRSVAGNIVIFLILLIVGIFLAAPLLYSVVTSLKPIEEVYVFPPRFFVRRPTMSNYTSLLYVMTNMGVPLTRYLFNSLFTSILATGLHVIFSSMAAYPLSKYNLRVSWLFPLVVGALLFNTTVLAIPQYLMLTKLRLVNTYLVYILPSISLPLGLFLMKQFMEKVPTSLIESAKIDGAGQMRTFFTIVMPNVKPAWLTLCVFAFQQIWNQQPMAMVYDEELKLINMVMTQVTQSGMARVGAAMAAGVLIMIPPLLVFLFTQSNVIETMSSSGIKE